MEIINLEKLTTENRNINTMNLDIMSGKEIITVMNEEDQKVAEAVKNKIDDISKAVDLIRKSFKNKGRLIYMGAGTSGRLGILDAVECVPTFGTNPNLVQGLIAGGDKAIKFAVEGAEDSEELGRVDLEKINFNSNDLLVGIAASGRTPYVIGALNYASKVGANTVSLSCNKNSEISKYSDVSIEIEVGPEILTGSTRLKAGTAQKMVLNMFSTASMVLMGKTYQNLMVDVKTTNDKLIQRAIRMICMATEVSYEEAEKVFKKSGKNVKISILMILGNMNKEEAIQRLKETSGRIRDSII